VERHVRAPENNRGLDRFLAAAYTLFAVGWVISDLPNALGVSTRVNQYYAQAIDPLFRDPPAALDAILKIAGLVYGPCYLAVVFALVWRRSWLPKIGVPLAVTMELTTLAYLAGDVFGPLPPRNLGAFLALNGPYAIVPLVLLYRLLRGRRGALHAR
jgi:EXPERA (EXPanded EBP superfamily)